MLKKIGRVILLLFSFYFLLTPLISCASSLDYIMISRQNYEQLERNLIELREINEILSSNLNLSYEELINLQMRQNQLVLELRSSKTELEATTKKLLEVENSLTIALESLEKANEKAEKLRDNPNNINVALLVGNSQSYAGIRYISKNFGAGVYKKIYGDDGSDYFIEANYTVIRF